MRWLSGLSLTERRDRGAVATIVTILLTFGLILGMLALSADLGSITAQRRAVQNASDAAAMTLASACSKSDTATCKSTAVTAAAVTGIAGANLPGVTVSDACASAHARSTDGGSVPLPLCAAGSSSDLGACLPASTTTSQLSYVEVRTTGTANTPFAAAIGAGASKVVPACSRAAWGPAGSTGNTLPLVMGYCDWAAATSTGTRYAPSPPYTPTPLDKNTTLPTAVSGYAVAIVAHSNADNSSDTCGRNANGGYFPGGFGWTTANEPCTAILSASGTVDGDTGSLPSPCKDDKDLEKYLGTEAAIPIAISATGSGNTAVFTLEGIAKFYVAGFEKVAAAQPNQSAAVYKQPSGVCTGKCNGSVTYIWGWFTSGMLPVGTSIGTGPSRGALQVAPAG